MSWLVTAWALLAAGFTAVTLFKLPRRPLRKSRVRRRPHVLLLRPMDAPTPLELDNLAARIDYAGPLTQVVLAPFRPRLRSANVRWLPSDPLTRNRKVGHLAYALSVLPEARDAIVITVDADVRVDGALLSSLVDALADGAALASAAPRPELGDSVGAWCHRGLLAQSHHSFEALDAMSAGAKAVCGKAMALSSVAAAELARLSDCIGEDLELSQVLHQRGLPVTLADAFAHVPQPPRVSARALSERFVRWMQVLRAHRPSLFPSVPLLFAPTPVLMVLASVVATPEVAVALSLLVGARIALANRLDRRGGLRFEWLLGEALLWWCWCVAVVKGRSVTWRGRRYQLEGGGRMRAVAEEGAAS